MRLSYLDVSTSLMFHTEVVFPTVAYYVLFRMDLQKHERAVDFNGSLPANGLPTMHEDFQFNFAKSLLAPMRRFDPNNPELLDRPGMDRALLREELQNLEDCNRRLGGHDLVLEYVERFVESTRAGSLSMLDMGTGAADVPRAIAAWGRQHRLSVVITAVDGNSEVLQIASESCCGWPEIQFEQHDLRALPYAANSFDLVLCSLALHHFESADAVKVLRSMHTLARRGCVLNDLCRSWLAILSTGLLVRAFFRSPVFRHDAAQSCRAAFTVRELRAMAERAGLHNFQIKQHHAMFRMVLEGRK